MESPPRLGLGIIYKAPLCGRTDLTTRVWVQILGMIWEGVRHLKSLNHGSASTHFFLRLNLIKGTFNIAFYTHTHTSIQHEISSEILTYISHASYIIINPSIYLLCISFKAANKSWQNQRIIGEH